MYNTLDQKIPVQMYMTLYCYYYGSISYLTLKKKKNLKTRPFIAIVDAPNIFLQQNITKIGWIYGV